MRARVVVAVVVIMLAPLSCAKANRIAVARLSETEHESEPVFVYEKAHGSFYVENIGPDAFRIASVKTTCACTTAVQTKGTIAPGDRAEIEYDISSAAPREKSVTIVVQTNPPLPEPLRFKASGIFKPVLVGEPDGLSIEARFGEPFEQSIALHPAPGVGSIRVTKVSTRQTWAEVTLENTPNSADPVVHVQSKDSLQPGTHQLGIAVEFERESPGRQDITAEVHVDSDYSVEPRQLIVNIPEDGSDPTTEITIRNKKKIPFIPRSVRAEKFQIEPPELPTEPSAFQRIPITFKLQDGTIARRGRLLLDLGDKRGLYTIDVFFSEPRKKS